MVHVYTEDGALCDQVPMVTQHVEQLSEAVVGPDSSTENGISLLEVKVHLLLRSVLAIPSQGNVISLLSQYHAILITLSLPTFLPLWLLPPLLPSFLLPLPPLTLPSPSPPPAPSST